MAYQKSSENFSKPPYKELSLTDDHHIKKQMYYFFPFLRQTYEAVRQQGEIIQPRPIGISVLSSFKNLACYYGSGLVFGNFDLKQEQKLIEEIFLNSRLPRKEFKNLVLSIRQNTFNKSDGNLNEYFFGDITPKELHKRELPGGPDYNMGASEGIASFNQNARLNLVQSLTKFIKTDSRSPSVSILGNVARGVIDAACIFTGLQRNGVKSQFNLYRVSPAAMGDTKPIVLAENFNANSWGITVDSLTVKGTSVPLALQLLNEVGFREKSVFLTYMGYNWVEELGVRFQWDSRHGEGNYAGTLLGRKRI